MESNVISCFCVLSLILFLPAGAAGPPIPRISLTLSKPATVIMYSDAASAGAMNFWSTRYLAAMAHSWTRGRGRPSAPRPVLASQVPRSAPARLASPREVVEGAKKPHRVFFYSACSQDPTPTCLHHLVVCLIALPGPSIAFDRHLHSTPTLAPPNPRSLVKHPS